MSWQRKREERRRVRDPHFVPMIRKKSGTMTSQNAPRGGTRNVQRELLEDFVEETNPAHFCKTKECWLSTPIEKCPRCTPDTNE